MSTSHSDQASLMTASIAPSDKATEPVRSFIFDALALPYVLEEEYATRYLAAGVNAVQLAVATDHDWEATLRGFDEANAKIERSPLLRLAKNASTARAAQTDGRLAVFLGTQGAGMIGPNLYRVSILKRLGLSCLGLCYTEANMFCDGCGERRNGGLTFLGQELIAAVNECGLILDLSHASHRARLEAAQLARAPVCTHANSYSVTRNDRNVDDAAASIIAQKGGVIGVTALPRAVRAQDPKAEDLLEHIAHFSDTIGIDRVGLGLDFSEWYKSTKFMPEVSVRWRTLRPDIFGTVDDYWNSDFPAGIRTIDDLPNLIRVLSSSGIFASNLRLLLGENWLNSIERFLQVDDV
ncbi:MAG: peptidase M19 [Mesorhizobium sp.]|nr:MAG: peptidase M19 [Mesorhizobium sp.]